MGAFLSKILLVCMVSASYLSAQEVPNSFDPVVLDSALSQAKNDSTRFSIQLRLADAFRNSAPEKSRKYLEEIRTNQVKGYESFQAKAYVMLTDVSLARNKLDSLDFFSSRGLEKAQQTIDTALILKAISHRAVALMALNKLPEGSELLLHSISLARQFKDTTRLLSSLMVLANMKGVLGQHSDVITLVEENEELWSKASPRRQAFFHFFKGRALTEIGKHEQALQQYHMAYPEFKELKVPINYVRLLTCYTESYLQLGKTDSAIMMNAESLLALKNSANTKSLAEAFISRASIYRTIGNLDSAAYYGHQAVNLLDDTESTRIYLLALKLLSEIESDRENWKESKLLTDKYLVIRDSLLEMERRASVDSLILLHEVAETEAALKTAEQKNLIQKLKWQRTLLFISGLSFVVLTFLGFFIYRKRKQLNLLAQERNQKEEELSQARQELKLKLQEVSNQEGNIVQLEDQLKVLRTQKVSTEEKLKSADIFNILKRNIKEESDWSLFEEYYSTANPSFLASLQKKHPQLTAHDMRLVSLIRLNLNSNEIAVLFNIAPDSVRKSRYRLAKKLDLEGEKDLYSYLYTAIK